MSADDDIKKSADLKDAIAALADIFIGRIPTTLSTMESELDAIIHNSKDHNAWKNLHRQLHTLAGTAGTFGHEELGDRARELEDRINTMLKTDTVSDEPLKSEFMHDQRIFMVWVDSEFVKKA